jgi:hypothetical protein
MARMSRRAAFRIGLTRRAMLQAGGAVAAVGLLAACGGGSHGSVSGQTVLFKRSGRGRRVSNAAKANNANKLFATAAAAAAGGAHPGDTSKVVKVPTTPATWDMYFGGGAQVVDLRHL